MKRNINRISIALLTALLISSFCVSAFAATETISTSGFYGIGSVANVKITPLSGSNTAESVSTDVDGDDVEDILYVNSDRLTVEYSAATANGYYGLILVQGSDLPTKENAIFYIDQVTASSNTVTFDVYPILPTEKTDLTLYISSSATNEELISVPLNYTIKDSFEIVSDYVLGDINLDEAVDINDAVRLFQYSMLPDIYGIDYTGNVDFTKDGVVDINDAVRLFQYSMLPDIYPIS